LKLPEEFPASVGTSSAPAQPATSTVALIHGSDSPVPLLRIDEISSVTPLRATEAGGKQACVTIASCARSKAFRKREDGDSGRSLDHESEARSQNSEARL